jgi:cysteine-rich repeat protein
MVAGMPKTWRCWTCVAMLLPLGCGDDTTPLESEGTTTTTGATTGLVDDTSATAGEVSTGDDTGQPETTADESTTEPSLCGNGEVDPGEECDDGNDEWLDECRPDCMWSFEELWTHSYDGPGNLFDVFSDVLVDGANTIYVCGSHVVEGSRRELLIKTYEPDGREGWTFSYRGEGEGHDYAGSMAWLPSGDLAICATTTTPEQGDALTVMRLTPGEDEPVWIREHHGPHETGDDACGGIAVDGNGDIVAVGSVYNEDARWDIAVVKYDEDGTLLWSRTHGDPFGGHDFGWGVAVDGDRNAMVLGRVREAQSLDRTWVRSYDPEGQERWTFRSGADGSPNWIASGIAIDADDNTMLTGSISSRVVTVRLDHDADEIWRYEASNGTRGNAVSTDSAGNILVAGELLTGTTGYDIWVGGFDAAGEPRWGFTYDNEVLHLNDWANGIVTDHDGDVIIVGVETVLGQQRNGWIRKIRPTW